MARAALAAIAEERLEGGSIAFFHRPRSEQQASDELNDSERMLILLSAEHSPYERLIAVGRPRLKGTSERERFWGFVDLVLDPFDMQIALGPQVYGSRDEALRPLPPAVRIASGIYDLSRHDDHAHFRWMVTAHEAFAPGLEVEPSADYLVSVANPDPAAWGLEVPPDLQGHLFDELEIHVTLPAPFPPKLQRRFDGRRLASLDRTDWLDHPGAELVFMSGAR